MEKASKRNIVLTVIVAILILVIGVSFAYFLAQTLINGEGSTSKVTTAVIKDTTFTVTGELEFNDEGIYPGHKNVSKIKVVAKENAGVTIDYNLIWNGRNGLATPINYYVYKTTSNENPSITCEVQKGMKSGYEIIYEECTNNNFNNLGEIISSGTITTSDETRKIILKENESIISSDEGTTVYYYVVLEYPNLDTAQNRDSEHTFQGEVTVELYERTTCGTHNVTTVLGVLEVNDCEPIFGVSSEDADVATEICSYNGEKVMAGLGATTEATCQKIYQVAGMGYVDSSITTMFQKQEGNGVWNNETSTCTYNGNDVGLFPSGSPTEEQCGKEIYLNTNNSTHVAGIEEVGAGIWGEATGKTGIYEVKDDMYGGTSYYFRGAVDNNYLKFADYCWRIVRINGDGSIRLIYDGAICHENGTSTEESIAIANQAYNASSNRSEYVGYTYVEGKQRPVAGDTEIESNLKIETEKWYQENIVSKGLDNKVATSKYCNDREVGEEYTWSSQPSSTFYYAPGKRIYLGYKPTLKCSNKSDIYTLKVGAITADEVTYAGAGDGNNTSYYLYNGQAYWTMSPYHWYSSKTRAEVFSVYAYGYLSNHHVDGTLGLRPVLSLSPNSLTISGSGTITDPYVAS